MSLLYNFKYALKDGKLSYHLKDKILKEDYDKTFYFYEGMMLEMKNNVELKEAYKRFQKECGELFI